MVIFRYTAFGDQNITLAEAAEKDLRNKKKYRFSIKIGKRRKANPETSENFFFFFLEMKCFFFKLDKLLIFFTTVIFLTFFTCGTFLNDHQPLFYSAAIWWWWEKSFFFYFQKKKEFVSYAVVLVVLFPKLSHTQKRKKSGYISDIFSASSFSQPPPPISFTPWEKRIIRLTSRMWLLSSYYSFRKEKTKKAYQLFTSPLPLSSTSWSELELAGVLPFSFSLPKKGKN